MDHGRRITSNSLFNQSIDSIELGAFRVVDKVGAVSEAHHLTDSEATTGNSDNSDAACLDVTKRKISAVAIRVHEHFLISPPAVPPLWLCEGTHADPTKRG